MIEGARHQIGDRVWRRRLSPLRYGTATVVDVMQTGGGEIEYAIVFDQHAKNNVRWYAEADLSPSIRQGSIDE